MVSKILSLAGFCLTLLTIEVFSAEKTVAASPVSATNEPRPRIQVANPVHDFGTIKEGAVCTHEFVFTNTGNAVLTVSSVIPACGCTTVSNWSKTVEPGKVGTISLVFDSTYQSGPIEKASALVCDDALQPTNVLKFKANVVRPLEINPRMLIMNIIPGSPSNLAGLAEILNHQEEPLTLSDPVSDNPYFVAELRTNRPGREFRLSVRTVPEFLSGNLHGSIKIKTSSKDTPELVMDVMAVIQPSLSLVPPVVLLHEPTNSPTTETISIRNNLDTPLTLSAPAINSKDVDIQIQTLETNRQFLVTLTFPPGFKLGAHDGVEFSIKTSNPEFPTIKVPVKQWSTTY